MGGAELFCRAAHKFYGPKGIGAAYIKKTVKFAPIITGGHQEKGKRAGTENVPAIAGFGKAIEVFRSEKEKVLKIKKHIIDKNEEQEE